MSEINGSEYALSILGNARRIEWEGDFPRDQRAIVEPVAGPLECLLPTWCQTVVFRYAPNLEPTLQVEVSVRNRWALIRMGPGWFALTEIERQNSLIHEMCHILVEPYHWTSARALEAYGPAANTPGRTLMDQVVRDGLEQAVEDMARAFQKVIRYGTG